MTAKRLAQRFVVTGYVKNLADGRVEIVVSGESGEIDRYLGAVANHLANHIKGQDVQEIPVQSFVGFEIRI